MIRVAVCGAAGRMGRLIVRQLAGQKDMKLVAAIDVPEHPMIGKDAGLIAGVQKLGVNVVESSKLSEVLRKTKPHVLVDFTTAEASVQNVKTAARMGVSVVVGTTGFTEEQRRTLEAAIKRGRIRAVISPNFSVGVNVFFKLAREAAKVLGRDYEPSVVEVHHVYKKDAPSGTALRAAEIVAEEFGIEPEEIKIKSIREGEVVGDHTLAFANSFEVLEITHRAKSREVFAVGTMKAIRYVIKKGKPGIIKDMQDVLGLR
ncbi:MAG: 4-hydroxy-tetrahydrodipicolinate reductase [Candidatus Hadarchaeum sp.]|uniref:4-hydroxy-tetrahydrodipicolinate reductase n=1 Tax=Candidatus Hadarchaeum sp. TaxID=2883567 RepID=UPI003D12C097